MPKVTKRAAPKKRAVTRKVVTSDDAWDRIEQLDVDDLLKVNIYGKSGTGKTRLWSTFPKPILAMLVSGGKKPGELKSIATPELKKVVSQVVLHKSTDVKEIVEKQAETGRFATVVLDHASDLQNMVLREILDIDELPPQLEWGTASREEWGQVSLKMRELLRSLLNLNSNVVVVAQERIFDNEQDEENPDKIVMPYVASALSPAVTGWLNPAVDYIVQTFKRKKRTTKKVKVGKKIVTKTVEGEGIEFCLRVGPDDVFTTKFRVPTGVELPDVIVDANYQKLHKLITGT